jgi:hypothetical protein
MGLPNLSKPLQFLADPLGIMPKSMRSTVADPLQLFSQPEQPAQPSQQQLQTMAQNDAAAKRAAAIDQANTTNASLSRSSMGAKYLGG